MANQYDTNLKLQAIADAIGDTQSSGLIQALEDIADAVAGGGGGSSAGLVSDNFSETDTYDLGDYCIHNNTLYVCINAITTPGAWDLSDWQATNAGLQLSSLNSALTDVTDVSSDIVLPATSGTSWGITAKIKNGWFSMCIPYFMPARTGDNQTIATGLPKALCQMQGMVGGANAGNTAVIVGAGTGVWINAGGTSLMGHIGANSASRAHWIYIQYQIDES